MTPSTVAGRRLAQPRIARRVSSGTPSARRPGAAVTAGAGASTVHRPVVAAPGYAPLGLRVVRRCAAVQDARLLDRLIRGRLWIGLIAVMLIGLVFVQLTLLNLNAGIGQSLERAATLERQNSSLALQVSKLSAGQRVEDAATARGMVMPAAGSVTYATAGRVPANVAVRGITEPRAAVAATPDATATTTDPASSATSDPAAAVTAATAPAAATTPVTSTGSAPPTAVTATATTASGTLPTG